MLTIVTILSAGYFVVVRQHHLNATNEGGPANVTEQLEDRNSNDPTLTEDQIHRLNLSFETSLLPIRTSK